MATLMHPEVTVSYRIKMLRSTIDRTVVHIAAVSIVRSAQNSQSIRLMLGDCLSDDTWEYVLCNKLLFGNYFLSEDAANRILSNLLTYLMKTSNNGLSLQNCLRDLLTVWSKKSTLNYTCLDQHIYTSKAIILAVKILHQNGGRINKTTSSTSDGKQIADDKSLTIEHVERLLFAGVPIHIESPDQRMLAIGMSVAESVLNVLNKDSAGKDESKFSFDYQTLKPESKHIADQLLNLHVVSESVVEFTESESAWNLFKMELDKDRSFLDVWWIIVQYTFHAFIVLFR